MRLLKIQDIFKCQCLKFFFNSENGNTPQHLANIFTLSKHNHDHNTRYRNLYLVNRPNRHTSRKTLRNYLASLINETPNNIINRIYTHSIDSFKRTVKVFYLDTYQTQCTKRNCYVCKSN